MSEPAGASVGDVRPVRSRAWVDHALLGAAVLAVVAGVVLARQVGAGSAELYYVAATLLMADAIWLLTRKPRSTGRLWGAAIVLLAAIALAALAYAVCWAAELGGERCWFYG